MSPAADRGARRYGGAVVRATSRGTDLGPARVAVWVGGLLAALTVVLLAATLDGAARRAGEVPGTAAYAALTVAPWLLAVGALRGRPVLLGPAALIAIATSPLLWSGMLLLLGPGALYLWAFARARPTHPRGLRRLAALALPPALVGAGWVVLFTGGEARCATGQSGAVCSEVVDAVPAAASVTAAVGAAVGGWLLGGRPPAPDAAGAARPVSRD